VRHPVANIAVVTACVAICVACGGSTATSLSPSPVSILPGNATVTFNGLTVDGASVTTYAESGVSVLPRSADWSVRTTYGNPAPFLQFWAPTGSTVAGEIQITAAGSPFYFKSIDLYSSTTTVPYTIKGLRNSGTVFTVTGTLPNTFGGFQTVANPNPADVIDTLSVTLINSAAPCCRNPMGLDNIVLTSTPTATPATFSLSGQVIDSITARQYPRQAF
jgi:hypothetical protein